MGGKDEDPVARVTGSLSLLDDQLKGIREAVARAVTAQASSSQQGEARQDLEALARSKVEVTLHDSTAGTPHVPGAHQASMCAIAACSLLDNRSSSRLALSASP